MDMSDQLIAYVIPAVVATLTAIGAAAGFLARKLWVGTSYYADKCWVLLEVAATKHFAFMDNLASSMTEQTALLTDIKDTLGSDPTGAGRLKEAVEQLKNNPGLCKYSQEELERYLNIINTVRQNKTKTQKE